MDLEQIQKELLDLNKRVEKLENKKKRQTQKMATTEWKEIMEIFYQINPSLDYKKPFNRNACEWFIGKWGLEETKRMAMAAISIQGKKFAPTVTTPAHLKERLAELKIYFDREKENKPKTLRELTKKI